MSDEAILDPKAIEEELAGIIEQRPVPVDEAIARLEALHGQPRKGKTESLTRALHNALIETADFHGFVRDCPTVRPDNVVFYLATVNPRHLHDVRVFHKVNVPFGGAVRNPGRFGIEK